MAVTRIDSSQARQNKTFVKNILSNMRRGRVNLFITNDIDSVVISDDWTLMANRNAIFGVDDGITRFAAEELTVPLFTVFRGLNVFNISSQVIIAVGSNGTDGVIVYSTDGGATFNEELIPSFDTSGYQLVFDGVEHVGGDPTGFANDATVYTADITVDGGAPQTITVTGSAAQTYTTAIAEINADLTGATASLRDGHLAITSDSTGPTSTILIADFDLFVQGFGAPIEPPIPGATVVPNLTTVQANPDTEEFVVGGGLGRVYTANYSDLTTWSEVIYNNVPGANTSVKALFFHDERFFLADRDPLLGGRIYTSDDDGATWTKRDVSGNFEVGFAFNGSAYYFSSQGSISKSVDGGDTWTEVYNTFPGVGAQYWSYISADPNGNVIIGGATDIAHFSEGDPEITASVELYDFGVETHPILACAPRYNSERQIFEVFVASGSYAGSTFYTINGHDWFPDVTRTKFYNPSATIVGDSNFSLISAGSGILIKFANNFNPLYKFISFKGSASRGVYNGTDYVVGGATPDFDPMIFKTRSLATSGSEYLEQMTVPGGLTGSFVNGVARNSATGTIVAVTSGSIIRSTDTGDTFSSVSPPASFNGANVKYGNGVFMIIGTGTGTVWTSADDGLTWDPHNVGVAESVAGRLEQGNGTWVVSGNLSNSIHKTVNNGSSWQEVTIGVIAAIADIVYISELEVWAITTTEGVFISFDDLNTFERVQVASQHLLTNGFQSQFLGLKVVHVNDSTFLLGTDFSYLSISQLF